MIIYCVTIRRNTATRILRWHQCYHQTQDDTNDSCKHASVPFPNPVDHDICRIRKVEMSKIWCLYLMYLVLLTHAFVFHSCLSWLCEMWAADVLQLNVDKKKRTTLVYVLFNHRRNTNTFSFQALWVENIWWLSEAKPIRYLSSGKISFYHWYCSWLK